MRNVWLAFIAFVLLTGAFFEAALVAMAVACAVCAAACVCTLQAISEGIFE